MKFFTRAWLNGEMSDEQFDAVPDSYWRYLTSLQLPPPIAALSEFNPHDAYVLELEYEPDYSTLKLRLRCGDLQVGYSDVVLAFSQVTVDPESLDTLRRALRPSEVEVLYEEVDRSDDRFEYRLIFFPDGEASIQFHEVSITRRSVATREAI